MHPLCRKGLVDGDHDREEMNERVRGAWHQGGGGLGQTCLDTLFVFDTFPKFVIRKRLVKVDQCSKMRIVGNMRIVGGNVKGTSASRCCIYVTLLLLLRPNFYFQLSRVFLT